MSNPTVKTTGSANCCADCGTEFSIFRQKLQCSQCRKPVCRTCCSATKGALTCLSCQPSAPVPSERSPVASLPPAAPAAELLYSQSRVSAQKRDVSFQEVLSPELRDAAPIRTRETVVHASVGGARPPVPSIRTDNDLPSTKKLTRSGGAGGPSVSTMGLADVATLLPTRAREFTASARAPPNFLKKEFSSLPPALCVGDSIALFSDAHNCLLACDGFLSSSCVSTLPGDIGWAHQSWRVIGSTRSDNEAVDDRLFPITTSNEPPTQENSAAMSPAMQASLLTRIDLELLKLAQWPRLLAARIESHDWDKLDEPALEELMLTSFRSDTSILGMAVAFESKVFRKSLGGEPVEEYARYVKWAPPNDSDVHPEDPHGQGHNHSRRDPCPITNSPCYGDAVFANLLPGEGYTPLYRHWYWYKPAKEGRSFWTDPYLDEGGANVPIITYSVPIHRAGVFVGVATMDVALAPGSTMGQPQSLDVDEESVAGDEGMSSESKAGVVSAAAAAKGKRKLEQLAKLPQAAARQLSDHLSSRPDVVSEVFVRQLLKGVMKGDGVFGACVAFEPNVFNGMQDKSFYVKRSEPATAPTPAAPAVVGVGEESKAPPLLPPYGLSSSPTSVGESKEDAQVAPAAPRPRQNSCCDSVASQLVDTSADKGVLTEDGYDFSALDYAHGYFGADWYQIPASTRKDRWSDPYFDAGGGDVWMVTYSVPFWNGSALGGIVTLDLEFSPSLRAAFASKDSFEDVHRCWSCQLPCTHSYRTVVHHVGHEKLCNRCFVNGLLPANTKLDDLVHKMSEECKDWWVHFRRAGTPVRYGHAIQLLHSGSGELLATRLKQTRSSSSSTLYELGLDTSLPDPYLEGSPDSWVIVVPAAPGRVIGEVVRIGDEISLVSRRWEWMAVAPLPPTGTTHKVTFDAEHSSHGVKSWRIVPFALHADSGPQSEASSSQANVSIDVEVSRIRNRFTTAWDDDHEPDDEDEKEEVEKKALKNAAENDALGSKHKAIYSGKSFMIKLVLDGSLLFGRAQTVLDGTAYGADAIGFGEEDALAKKGHSAISREDIANSLLESSAKSAAAAVAALSVPAQSDTIWCIIFTDGSGGPAKFGTCFYLQHLLTGRYLAFPPELSSPEESVVTLVGSLAFVRPKLVVLPSEATPFFVFRGTAAGTDAEGTGEVARCQESTKLACRVAKRLWWVGLPDTEGRLDDDSAPQQSEIAERALWLWNQRDAAIELEWQEVPEFVSRKIRRVCETVQSLQHHVDSLGVGTLTTHDASAEADQHPKKHTRFQLARSAYRHWLGDFERGDESPHVSQFSETSEVKGIYLSLMGTAELLLKMCLFLRGEPIDIATIRKVAQRAVVSSALSCSDEVETSLHLRSASASWPWSGLLSTSTRNMKVIPEHQEVVRERRGVETLVALLETLRGTLEKRLSQAIEHLGIKVVSLCLKTLSLLISRSHQCCVSAALHLPLLMKFVVVEYLPKPATADVDKHLEPCSRDLARLAAALLQEIIRRHREVRIELSLSQLGTLIKLSRSISPLPVAILSLLTSLVSQPSASSSSISANVESLDEELVLLDCLGTGEVCTFPRNQSEIIHELLLADDARFVRACRCRNFWDKLRRDFSDKGYEVKEEASEHEREIVLWVTKDGAVELLRLLTRACMGAIGAPLAAMLRSQGGFKWSTMIERMFDDQFPFAIRAQLAHLFRVLYVSPQLVSAATNPRDGVSFVTATRAGCGGTGASTESSEASVTTHYKGILVSNQHLQEEVSWGRGFVGAAVAGDPSVSIFRPGTVSKVTSSPWFLSGQPNPPTQSMEDILLAGDAPLPTIDPMLIQLFKEYLTPFLNNCLALRDQHIFTMAILKLVHGLVERGALDVNACGSLVPSFKSMLAEDDPFTAAKDDSWKIGMRLLLRIKLAAASTLHLMLDRAAHDSALKSFQQEKAGRIVPLSRTESTQGKSSRRFARTEKSADPGVDIIPLSPVWASVTVPDSSGQPSLARILYDLLGKSDFQPLLRSCSFLLIRLHSGSSEYDVTLSGACSLHTSYEYTFVRTAHAILQRIRVLSLPERIAERADEIQLVRASVICPEICCLIDLLTCGLMYGTFDAAVIGQPLLDMARRRLPHHAHTTVDDEADLLYRAIRREDSAAESLSSPRAAALLHALDTHGLLMELLFVPVNHNWMLTSHGVVTTLTPQDHHSMPYQSTPEYVGSHSFSHVIKACFWLLALISHHHNGTKLYLQQHVNAIMSLSGNGLQSSLLVEILVSDSKDACVAVEPRFILSSVKKLTHPKERRRLRCLRLLRNLTVLNDGSLVHRNQMLVVRAICEDGAIMGYLRRLDDMDTLRAFKNIVDAPGTSPRGVGMELALSDTALVFARLVELLSACAPNKLAYRKGVAIRENEEAALIIQSAVPIQGVVSALLSVSSWWMKAVLLRFLEQVWGTLPLSITPAVSVVDLTPATRLTPKPATAMSPIVIHLFEDMYVAFQAWSATGGPHGTDTSGLETYLFEAALPFLVGFFHTSFDSIDISKKDSPIRFNATELFKLVLTTAEAVLQRERHLRMEYVQSLMNTIVHMHDPEGTLRCSGVNGGRSDDEIFSVVSGLQSIINSARKLEAVVQHSSSLELVSPGSMRGSLRKGSRATLLGSPVSANSGEDVAIMPHHDGFADLVTLVGCDDELLGQLIALLSDIGSSTATRSKGHGRSLNTRLEKFSAEVLLLPFLRALRRLASSDDETTSDAVSNRLVGVGAPRLVVCLMSWAESTNDEAVMLQCLNLACSLVKGGVRAAQDSFLQEVSSHFSSQFFSSLMHIVKSCDLRFPTIKEFDQATEQGKAMFRRSIDRAEALCLSLSFMQGLCEGHRLDWQNILRDQPGSVADIDVVTALATFAIQLCRKSGPMWSILVYWDAWYSVETLRLAVKILLQVFKTLTELVQGPCPGNQSALSNTNLMEAIGGIWDAVLKAMVHHPNRSDSAASVAFGRWDSLKDISVEQDRDPSSIEEFLANEESDSVYVNSRRAVYMELQSTMISLLNGLLEGPKPVAVAARIIRQLELTRIPELLNDILIEAHEYVHSHPKTSELVIETDAARVSDGIWDARFSSLDLCITYIGFLRQLGLAMGLRADLKLQESSLEKCSSILRPLYDLLEVPQVRYAIDITAPYIAQVEVLRDYELETIVFRVPPAVVRCKHDAEIVAQRDWIKFNVNRDNSYAKIESFVDMACKPDRKLGLANMLLSNPRLKHNILVRAYPLSMNLSLVFAILCNCFLLADYSDFSNSPRAHSALSTTLTVMGAILVAVSTFRLIGYFLVWIPAWLSQPPKAKSRKDKHVAFSELKPELHDYRRKNRAKGGQASIQPTTSSDSQEDPAFRLHLKTARMLVNRILFSPRSLYMITYTGLAYAGLFASPLFYCFHLIDLVFRSRLLQETLSSLRHYAGSLLSAGGLWLLLMYLFAIIAYAKFPSSFPGDECYNLIDCIAYVLDFGLRAGGGLGDFLEGGGQGDVNGPATSGFARLVFDDAFFVLISVVMLSIVAGIIIDAFGASRDQKNFVNIDQKNKCFVCGLESSKFERHSRGFKYHHRHEHNMWNYVYLVTYLRLKDPQSLTGLESYIVSQREIESIDFFPVGQATMVRTASEAQHKGPSGIPK